MFSEYNGHAIDLGLGELDSVEELEQILRDNVDEDTLEILEADREARMVFAGHLSAILMEIDITVAYIGVEDGEAPSGSSH
jgi:hypothetical protein